MAKIIGHGAPTSKTFGVLGQEYFDKDSNKVYTCTKVTHKTAYRAGEADAEYEWSIIGGGSDLFEVKKNVETILAHTVIADVDYVNGGALEADKEYTVVLDGIEYKVVAIKNNNMVGVVVPFGNEAFIYSSVVYSTGGGYGWIEEGADLAETVAIYAEGEPFIITKSTREIIEILPEQTSFGEPSFGYALVNYNFILEANTEYVFIINGEKYTAVMEKGSGYVMAGFETSNGDWFGIMLGNAGGLVTYSRDGELRFDLLESLAIYEDKVSRLLLDSGLINTTTVLYTGSEISNGVETYYLYHDIDKSKKVSKNELRQIMLQGSAVLCIDDMYYYPVYRYMLGSYDKFGTVLHYDFSGSGTDVSGTYKTYFTKEFVY